MNIIFSLSHDLKGLLGCIIERSLMLAGVFHFLILRYKGEEWKVGDEIDAVERYFMYIVCYLAFIYAMGDLQGYIDIYRKSHPPFR